MGIIKVGHKKLFLLVSNATTNPHLLKILQTGMPALNWQLPHGCSIQCTCMYGCTVHLEILVLVASDNPHRKYHFIYSVPC